MQTHEYLAVPAPAKGMKVKGLKTPAERYAHALSAAINDLAADGWEYWRAETLPSEERKGLTGSVTIYHSMLIFRRPSAEALARALQSASPAMSAPVQAPPIHSSPITLAAPAQDAPPPERDLIAEAENLFASPDADSPAPETPAAPLRLSTRAPEGTAPRVLVSPRNDRPRDD